MYPRQMYRPHTLRRAAFFGRPLLRLVMAEVRPAA